MPGVPATITEHFSLFKVGSHRERILNTVLYLGLHTIV